MDTTFWLHIVPIAMAVLGVLLAVQWLYFWPKVQSIVKAAVLEAMEQEHAYVLREIERVDRRHDVAILAMNTKMAAVEVSLDVKVDYIRDRLDWLIAKLMENHIK